MGKAFANVWIFLLLLHLSARRGPAALGRGEVPPPEQLLLFYIIDNY